MAETVEISLDRVTLHRPSATWRPKVYGNGVCLDAGNIIGDAITRVAPGTPFEVSATEAANLLRRNAGAIHSENPPAIVAEAKAQYDKAHHPHFVC